MKTPQNKIDLPKIIKSNEVTINGKKVLFIKSNKKNQKLLIIMSTHNQGSNYLALRSFVENQYCDLLFVCDPNNTWYLDSNYGESFHQLFKHYTRQYKPENIYFFGSSMSGYGALLHGLRLNSNIIAANPQINLDVTARYSWPELEKNIKALKGKHINIDEHINNLWQESSVYIVHGHNEMDILNINLLLSSNPIRKRLIIQTMDIDTHAYPFGREVKHIYQIIKLLNHFRMILQTSHLEAELNTDSFIPVRRRRMNAIKAGVIHPLQHPPLPNAVLWQSRHLLEKAGTLAFFQNIGLYKNGKTIGALCTFDGDTWRYLTPTPDISDLLLSPENLEVSHSYLNAQNLDLIENGWIIRKQENGVISINGTKGIIHIDYTNNGDSLAFLHLPLRLPEHSYSTLEGCFITFSADVFTDNGNVMLAIGGYGSDGYYHSNSSSANSGQWTTLRATELFSSFTKNHHDRLFIRLNFGADRKSKNLKISNMKILVGYFPEGLSL